MFQPQRQKNNRYFIIVFLLIIIRFFPWVKLLLSRLFISNISLSFFLLSSVCFLIIISGGSNGSKLLYPKISLESQSTIIFPWYSSIKSFVDKFDDSTPNI